MQSGLPATEALRQIEAEKGVGDQSEVRLLIDFVRSARRGVVLKRRKRVLDHDE
jgi:hypothetical protein